MRGVFLERAKLCLAFALLVILSPAYAEGEPVWLQMERARTAYETGEYGTALELTLLAKQARHAETMNRLAVLKAALAPAQVRKAGDDIALIRPVLAARDEKEAIAILDEMSASRFAPAYQGSAAKLLHWLERSDVFPEADFLEGMIHDAEGETAIALRLYLRAWENREFLDIPDQRFDILYRMAESSAGMGDLDTAEKDYLQILSDDPLYGTPDNPGPTLRAMRKTLVTDSDTDKFISLYRHVNRTALKAASRLAELYLGTVGSDARALNVSILAACMSISELDIRLRERNVRWDGSSLESLFMAVSSEPDLASWATSLGLWDPYLSLARSLFAAGNSAQAVKVLESVKDHCPEGSVRGKAAGLLGFLQPRS